MKHSSLEGCFSNWASDEAGEQQRSLVVNHRIGSHTGMMSPEGPGARVDAELTVVLIASQSEQDAFHTHQTDITTGSLIRSHSSR